MGLKNNLYSVRHSLIDEPIKPGIKCRRRRPERYCLESKTFTSSIYSPIQQTETQHILIIDPIIVPSSPQYNHVGYLYLTILTFHFVPPYPESFVVYSIHDGNRLVHHFSCIEENLRYALVDTAQLWMTHQVSVPHLQRKASHHLAPLALR